MTANQYVSQDTLNTVLDLLKENREVTRNQIKSVGEKVDDLSTQLTKGIDQITDRQDFSNGRMNKAETALAAVKKEVDELLNDGCHQKSKHIKVLSKLYRPTADSEDTTLPFTLPLGNPELRKKIAVRVGVGSGLLGLGIYLPEILNAVHRMIDHFTQ